MKLTKLAPSTRVQGRWLCYLEDDTILRVSESEVVAFALYSGMELDDDKREQLAASAQKTALKGRALNLIAARPLSRKELVKKLVEKDAEPTEAEEIADWLEGFGYLNDAEYARTLVRHYENKGYGERKIQDELWRRGVPREYWEGAMEESRGAAEGIDRFLRSKLKGALPDPKELKKVSDALARRGYRWDDIKDGLRRYGTELDED